MELETIKDNIRQNLGITKLNDIQMAMIPLMNHTQDVVLYAPTGSGKTVAYSFPLLAPARRGVGALAAVIVPTRELAIQTTHVIRSIAREMKVTCCYGGHSVEDERRSLCSGPDLIVATPGRLLDHIGRGNASLSEIQRIVLDEFDKTLELGFADEMQQLMKQLPPGVRKILTSATTIDPMPVWLHLNTPAIIDGYRLAQATESRLTIWRVDVGDEGRMPVLYRLLNSLGTEQSIVFANQREDVDTLQRFLERCHVDCVAYHGGLNQQGREMALAKFTVGAALVLITTDLAARGLDIPGIKHIIHYGMPQDETTYVHRNGRSARVEATGNVYVILEQKEEAQPFMRFNSTYRLDSTNETAQASMMMLHIKAGRKEKISRGDVLGFVSNASDHVTATDVGKIIIFDHYSLVGVGRHLGKDIVDALNSAKLKGRRVRVTLA